MPSSDGEGSPESGTEKGGDLDGQERRVVDAGRNGLHRTATNQQEVFSCCKYGRTRSTGGTDLADDVLKVDVPRLGPADRRGDPGSGTQSRSSEKRHDQSARLEMILVYVRVRRCLGRF